MAPHTCSDRDSPLPPVQPASASAGIRPSSRQRGLERPREDAGSPGSRRPARPPRFPHTVPLVGNQEPVKASLSVAAQLHQLQGRRLSDPAVILGDLHTARLSRRDASVAASASCRRGVEAGNVAGRWGPPPLSLRVTSGGHSPPASGARAPSPRPRPTLGPSTCRPRACFQRCGQGGLRGLGVGPAGVCPETVSITEAGGHLAGQESQSPGIRIHGLGPHLGNLGKAGGKRLH